MAASFIVEEFPAEVFFEGLVVESDVALGMGATGIKLFSGELGCPFEVGRLWLDLSEASLDSSTSLIICCSMLDGGASSMIWPLDRLTIQDHKNTEPPSAAIGTGQRPEIAEEIR